MGLRLVDLVGTARIIGVDERVGVLSDEDLVPWGDISDDDGYDDWEGYEGCADCSDPSECPGCEDCRGWL